MKFWLCKLLATEKAKFDLFKLIDRTCWDEQKYGKKRAVVSHYSIFDFAWIFVSCLAAWDAIWKLVLNFDWF